MEQQQQQRKKKNTRTFENEYKKKERKMYSTLTLTSVNQSKFRIGRGKKPIFWVSQDEMTTPVSDRSVTERVVRFSGIKMTTRQVIGPQNILTVEKPVHNTKTDSQTFLTFRCGS